MSSAGIYAIRIGLRHAARYNWVRTVRDTGIVHGTMFFKQGLKP